MTRFTSLCWLLLLGLGAGAVAAPYRPATDQEVLETLPLRWADASQRELRELRLPLAAQAGNADLAVRLARRYYAEVAAEGDPRYVGHAQAALAPWWDEAAPPPSVRVMRSLATPV